MAWTWREDAGLEELARFKADQPERWRRLPGGLKERAIWYALAKEAAAVYRAAVTEV
jgi:hypothetical protein